MFRGQWPRWPRLLETLVVVMVVVVVAEGVVLMVEVVVVVVGMVVVTTCCTQVRMARLVLVVAALAAPSTACSSKAAGKEPGDLQSKMLTASILFSCLCPKSQFSVYFTKYYLFQLFDLV